jgi:hypothetical protein
MKEEWRPVPGWEGGYEVSSLGRVKSLARRVAVNPRGFGMTWMDRKEKILPGYRDPQRKHRRTVTLNFAGKRREAVLVAHLVAEAFLGPCPEGMMVCHNNGKASDDRLVNLRHDTPKGNMADVVKHGRMKARSGEGHYRAKLTVEQVREIRASQHSVSIVDLVAKYRIGETTLRHILARRTWKDVD